MNKWNIVESSKNEMDWIENQIDIFNRKQISFAGKSEIFLNYTVKQGDEIVAGVSSCFYLEEALFVNVIFVTEEYRGKGMGSVLLKKVEDEARKRGAKLAHLQTFDFHKAKEFYIKHGYEVFGMLDDYPAGYKQYYLKKKL